MHGWGGLVAAHHFRSGYKPPAPGAGVFSTAVTSMYQEDRNRYALSFTCGDRQAISGLSTHVDNQLPLRVDSSL